MEHAHFHEGPYYMYSNFSAFSVWWRGMHWMTAEHAYQASKFWRLRTWSVVLRIFFAASPYEAKEIAKKYEDKKRPDWREPLKRRIMEAIVWAKLVQHRYIQKSLLETGEKILIEDSSTDTFWGRVPGKGGENVLGQIWMQARERLKRKNRYVFGSRRL